MNPGNALHDRLKAVLLELSKRPNGFGNHDVSGYTVAYVGQTATVMARRGLLFKGRTSYHNVRFFDTAEAAAAWERSENRAASDVGHSARASVTHAPTGRAKHQRAWWPADAEPVFTPATIYTYGASPGQAYRTNTHSE